MGQVYCVVMAGGKGTRFWPESTGQKPKQYLTLMGEKSLLEQTFERFEGLIPTSNQSIVTVAEQQELAMGSLKGKLSHNQVILEPSGRNTAPCILLALASWIKWGAKPEDTVAILPSDHVILNQNGFKQTMREAIELSRKHKKLITIGIRPQFPHTGFGYIQAGAALETGHLVERFKEKPDFETAKSYVAAGNFFWNAGMFVGCIGTFLEEFARHAPQIYKHFDKLSEHLNDAKLFPEIYNSIPADSIDYAIMEKSDKVLVVPAKFDWNDLGSWEALEAVMRPQGHNTVAAARHFHGINAQGNIVYTPDRFCAVIGVNDLVVVSNEKAVLVVPKSQTQEVRKVVEFLKSSPEFKDLL